MSSDTSGDFRLAPARLIEGSSATPEHPSYDLADQGRAERPVEALLFEMALGVAGSEMEPLRGQQEALTQCCGIGRCAGASRHLGGVHDVEL